jgi:hypothetical protein
MAWLHTVKDLEGSNAVTYYMWLIPCLATSLQEARAGQDWRTSVA